MSRGPLGQIDDSSLALDEAMRRLKESWDTDSMSMDHPAPDGAVPAAGSAEAQLLDYRHRSSATKGHLGKRTLSGVYEETLERKRRAVDNGGNALGGLTPSVATSNGKDKKSHRRASAPTAGMAGGTSVDKSRDGPQVLRAVRSPANKPLPSALRGADSRSASVQVLEKTPSGRPYRSIVGKNTEERLYMPC